MSADLLLARLERVKRTGPGRWMARCPAHKDRRASLSVRELDDGVVLAHCFAGCEVGAVVHAADLQLEDLFPPRQVGAVAGRPPERRPFSVRDLMDALSAELHVAWVVLGDVAAGRDLNERDRKRAGLARVRCMALVDELRNVR